MPKAIIYQHPSAEVILKDPRDPYVLPQLGHDTAIKATAPADEEQFCVCGVPTRHHYTLDLREWLGCDAAQTRTQGPRNPQRWNDHYPAATCAVRLALLAQCGPAMETFFDSTYTHDEKVTMCIQIASAAIKAYRDGK